MNSGGSTTFDNRRRSTCSKRGSSAARRGTGKTAHYKGKRLGRGGFFLQAKSADAPRGKGSQERRKRYLGKKEPRPSPDTLRPCADRRNRISRSRERTPTDRFKNEASGKRAGIVQKFRISKKKEPEEQRSLNLVGKG